MFFLLFFSLLLSQHHCAEIYNITRSQPLSQDQSLVSPRNIFVLGFFRPGNLDNKYVAIWYRNISPQKVVWVANREKPITASDTLARLIINSYGNLELVDGKQNSVWSTNISRPYNSSSAVLLDTGNLVFKDGIGDDPLWQSFDHPSDTQLPELVLGFDTNSGTRSVLTAWKSESDPSAGLFSAGLSSQTPSQVFIWFNGSKPYWRSGPWDKSRFIGVPDMNNLYGSGFKLAEDDPLGTKNFSFKLSDGTFSYIDLSSEGVLKYMLSDNGSDWWVNWLAPNNTYDTYGKCGVFGILKTSELPTPKCNCFKGFVPNSDEEWSKGNTTGGCERKTKLFCGSNINDSVPSEGKEDGFWEMKMVKLPDLHELKANLDAYECKVQCLNDCACLAYAYPDNIGCLVWSNNLIDVQEFTSGGADLFIRLADAELGEEGRPIKLIVIFTVIGFISILGAILFGVHRLRANRRGNTEVETKFFPLSHTSQNSRDDLQEYIRKHDGSELSIYSFDSILIATNNFSIMNKLGEGGFGPVYQGKLQEGNEIAVKRLSSSSGQGIEEFKNEMLLISKLQHKNLVRIMGCCIKEDEKLLVYEFMPNRSLDTLLFDPKRRSELDWGRRFNIIQGVARGLLYLHHDSRLKVIHRDLKVSNILLDENMNAKISDFGLARIVEGTQNINTQKVVGTLGYMSPEYAMGGIFSEKSDVYSFGVLLLEIISGRKNTSFYYNPKHLSLLAYIWHLWNDGRGLHLADEVLADSYSSSEVMRCLHIGLLCVQDKAADRPSMPDVVFMLSNETVLPQAKEPIFTFQNSVYGSQPHKFDSAFSANGATITTIEGR